jgi:hypothetical protein
MAPPAQRLLKMVMGRGWFNAQVKENRRKVVSPGIFLLVSFLLGRFSINSQRIFIVGFWQ